MTRARSSTLYGAIVVALVAIVAAVVFTFVQDVTTPEPAAVQPAVQQLPVVPPAAQVRGAERADRISVTENVAPVAAAGPAIDLAADVTSSAGRSADDLPVPVARTDLVAR